MNNKISVCLSGKDELCDAGDEKRIENPGDKREQEKKYDRWFYLVPDYGGDSILDPYNSSDSRSPNLADRECYCSCNPREVFMTIEGFECSKPKNKDYISGYDLRVLWWKNYSKYYFINLYYYVKNGGNNTPGNRDY